MLNLINLNNFHNTKIVLVWVFHSTRKNFNHTETLPLPMKGWKFSPMLGTHGHLWPQRLWHGAYIYNGNFRGPLTLTPIAEHLAVELSLPVFTTYVWLGFEHPTFHFRDERTNPLRCRIVSTEKKWPLWNVNTISFKITPLWM